MGPQWRRDLLTPNPTPLRLAIAYLLEEDSHCATQKASPPDQNSHQSRAPTDNWHAFLNVSLFLFSLSLLFFLPSSFSFGNRLRVSDLTFGQILYIFFSFFLCFVCLFRNFYSILLTSFQYLLHYFPFSLFGLSLIV